MKKLLFALCGLGAALSLSAQNTAAPAPTAATGKAGSPTGAPAPTGSNAVSASRDQDGKVNAPDGILRAQGSMMYLKSGALTRVTYELKLKEGLIARPNGEVVLPGGKTVTLQEGQMVTLDGKMTQAPTGLGSTAPGSAGTLPPDSTKTDFGNSGESTKKK